MTHPPLCNICSQRPVDFFLCRLRLSELQALCSSCWGQSCMGTPALAPRADRTPHARLQLAQPCLSPHHLRCATVSSCHLAHTGSGLCCHRHTHGQSPSPLASVPYCWTPRSAEDPPAPTATRGILKFPALRTTGLVTSQTTAINRAEAQPHSPAMCPAPPDPGHSTF